MAISSLYFAWKSMGKNTIKQVSVWPWAPCYLQLVASHVMLTHSRPGTYMCFSLFSSRPIFFSAGTNFYTWVERDTVCFAEEHNYRITQPSLHPTCWHHLNYSLELFPLGHKCFLPLLKWIILNLTVAHNISSLSNFWSVKQELEVSLCSLDN